MTIWNKARSIHNRKTPTSRPMTKRVVGPSDVVQAIIRSQTLADPKERAFFIPTWVLDPAEFLAQFGGVNSVTRGSGSVAVDTALAKQDVDAHMPIPHWALPKMVDYGQLPAGVSCGSCQCVHEAPACKPFELRDFAESPAQDEALMMGDDLSSHPGSGKLLASKPVGEWPAGTITRDTQPAAGKLTREMIMSATWSARRSTPSSFDRVLQTAADKAMRDQAKIEADTGVKHEWRQHPTRLGLLQCVPVNAPRPLTPEELTR
jgi:hypothetical protein